CHFLTYDDYFWFCRKIDDNRLLPTSYCSVVYYIFHYMPWFRKFASEPVVNLRRRYPLCCDNNDQLPAATPLSHFSRISCGGLSEQEHSIHDRMETTRLQQVSNLSQLFTIGFNDKKRLFHAVVGSCLAIRGDGDHPSVRLEYTPGSLQSVTADR